MWQHAALRRLCKHSPVLTCGTGHCSTVERFPQRVCKTTMLAAAWSLPFHCHGPSSDGPMGAMQCTDACQHYMHAQALAGKWLPCMLARCSGMRASLAADLAAQAHRALATSSMEDDSAFYAQAGATELDT